MTITVVEFLLSGFTDNSGLPLAYGKVYTYSAGTTTPKPTYTDSSAVTPEANPVILDSNGRKQIFASGNYKFVVKDSMDNTLYTFDNLFFGTTQDLAGVQATNAGNATSRSSLITYGQVQDCTPPYISSVGGSANAITLTPGVAIPAYAAGQFFRFQASNTNTGVTTINISGLGVKTVKKGFSAGYDLLPGDIISGGIITVMYDGTYFRLLSVEPMAVTTLAAAGTTQGTATAIASRIVNVSSGTLHQGLVLPVPIPGQRVTIGAYGITAPILIYPASGCNFAGFSTNQPITLYLKETIDLVALNTAEWAFTLQPGVFQQTITALANNTQSGAFQISYPYNSISTCTAGNNSVILPHPHPGRIIHVSNNSGGSTLNVFPAVGDRIAAAAINAAITVAITTGLCLVGIDSSTWRGFSNTQVP